jgi:hypothetical protein
MPPANVNEEQPLLRREIGEEQDEHEREEVKFREDDEENPRAWDGRKKLINVAIIALMSLLSPLASSMFTPGIEQVAEDLNNRPAKCGGDHDWLCYHARIRTFGDCTSLRPLGEGRSISTVLLSFRCYRYPRHWLQTSPHSLL